MDYVFTEVSKRDAMDFISKRESQFSSHLLQRTGMKKKEEKE